MTKQKEVRALIVEDDSLVGEMIKGLLADIGYTVAGKAASGLQAIEMTQSLQPDVVLMDIKMPDMDGLEATQHIYESCPTPVVVLTAFESSDLLEQASAAGVGAYLVKPSSAPEMERAITIAMARFDDMMELHRLNDQLQARNEELQEALAKVNTLSGLLPICASCKKIRDDQGYWQQVEIYVSEHSEAEFSHGFCPECMQRLYPEFYEKSNERKQDIVAALVKLGRADLAAISAAVGLPEPNTLNRLQNMVRAELIKRLEADGQILYELP